MDDTRTAYLRLASYCSIRGKINSLRKELPLKIKIAPLAPLLATLNQPLCKITFPEREKLMELQKKKDQKKYYGPEPKFDFYLSINHYPTKDSYDFKFENPKTVKIPEKYSSLITEKDSLRFLICAKADLDVSITPYFKGVYKQIVENTKIRYWHYPDYMKFFKVNLYIPKRILKQIEREKRARGNEDDIVNKNRELAWDLDFETKNQKILEFKNLEDQKAAAVKERRRVILRDKKRKTMKGLNRFLRVKVRNQKIVNFIISQFLDNALKLVWVKFYFRYQVLSKIRDMFYVNFFFFINF